MREILFRGRSMAQGSEWLYGDVLLYENSAQIWETIDGRKHNSVVSIKTIGQYTGLTDKNGKKIFEGDILEFSDRLVSVFWHAHLGCWDSNFLKFTNQENGRDDMSPCRWEYKAKVIGNIHDNPELLKGGEG